MKNNIPVLFQSKSICCGCGACMSVCPSSAITMVKDDKGFLYPKIDEKFCIHCKKCKIVCAFQNSEINANFQRGQEG